MISGYCQVLHIASMHPCVLQHGLSRVALACLHASTTAKRACAYVNHAVSIERLSYPPILIAKLGHAMLQHLAMATPHQPHSC